MTFSPRVAAWVPVRPLHPASVCRDGPAQRGASNILSGIGEAAGAGAAGGRLLVASRMQTPLGSPATALGVAWRDGTKIGFGSLHVYSRLFKGMIACKLLFS